MGWRLVGEVLDHYHGPTIKKIWLLSFAYNANDESRTGWPGRPLLAWRTDKSPSRVSNIATELVDDKSIERAGTGGRHRGGTKYVLLPIEAPDGCPCDACQPVDNSGSQGSPTTNPEHSQGSESHSQGSESGSQGSAISPRPARTSYNSKNSQEQSPRARASGAAPRAWQPPRQAELCARCGLRGHTQRECTA